MSQPQQVKASLGCGTLILIAIIVILFNGHNDHDQLEKKLDRLSDEIEQLQMEIQSLKAAIPSSSSSDGAPALPPERE